MTFPHSYYAHPEILLFCTLFSKFSTLDEEEESLEKMLQFKKVQLKSKAKKIRTFKKPDEKEFNLKARNPLDMIHWEVIKKSKLTPSPALRDISPNELKEWVKNKCPEVRKKIINVLSHSQYCEQSVNMVSKAVSKVVNHADQKAKIIVTKESQEEVPILCTKKDFRLSRAKRQLKM